MKPSIETKFNYLYQHHCKHLKLKEFQPKTNEAYIRVTPRIGDYFNDDIETLTQD